MYSIFFKHIFLNYSNRYAMSDSLCGLLKIELTERHLPARPDNPVVALPPSSMKVRAPPQVQRNQMPPTRQTNSYSALAKV